MLVLTSEQTVVPQQMLVWKDMDFEFNPLALQVLVFQQYVGESVVEAANSSAVQTLDFSQDSGSPVLTRFSTAAQTLSLTQEATGSGRPFTAAEQTVTLSQEATATAQAVSQAVQTLDFSQSGDASGSAEAIQTLDLTQVADGQVIRSSTGAQIFTLQQATGDPVIALGSFAVQTLSFLQSVTLTGAFVSQAVQTLPFSQVATYEQASVTAPRMAMVKVMQQAGTVVVGS
jgi:hypothetical protein